MKGSAAQPQPQPNPKKHCLKLLLGALSGDEDEYEATMNSFDRNSSSSTVAAGDFQPLWPHFILHLYVFTCIIYHKST